MISSGNQWWTHSTSLGNSPLINAAEISIKEAKSNHKINQDLIHCLVNKKVLGRGRAPSYHTCCFCLLVASVCMRCMSCVNCFQLHWKLKGWVVVVPLLDKYWCVVTYKALFKTEWTNKKISNSVWWQKLFFSKFNISETSECFFIFLCHFVSSPNMLCVSSSLMLQSPEIITNVDLFLGTIDDILKACDVGSLHVILYQVIPGSADEATFRAFLSSLMMQSPKQQEFWIVSVWSENDKATWELIGKSYPGPRSSSSSSSCRKSAQFFLRRALSVCMTYTPCQLSLFQWEAWQNQNSFAKNLQIYSSWRC